MASGPPFKERVPDREDERTGFSRGGAGARALVLPLVGPPLTCTVRTLDRSFRGANRLLGMCSWRAAGNWGEDLRSPARRRHTRVADAAARFVTSINDFVHDFARLVGV